MNHEYVIFVLFGLLFFTLRHYLYHNDEIPVILVVFNLMVENRLNALQSGRAEWISYDYKIDFTFDMELAYIASGLICLGTTTIVIAYLFFYKEKAKEPKDKEEYFSEFILKNKILIIVGFILFFLFQVGVGALLSKGYSFLLTLATSSFIILLFLVFYYSKSNLITKVLYGIVFSIIAYSTYDPYLRFQFLGWAIPIAVFIFRKATPMIKSLWYLCGLGGILIAFSIAGVMRAEDSAGKSFSELYDKSMDALLEGNDVNFIDGFVMLYQVYPQYLDFHYGKDHLAVLLRPVPRAWWPGKPQGGWVQKFASRYGMENFNTGISPTLYGVFYGEGGKWAIVIFGILWAWMFVRIKLFSENYADELQYIIKGLFIAALVPVLRSGDMAGDISIVGMSYWPIMLFVYRYNKFLKEKESVQTIQPNEAIQI
ncbi:MAG: hypothetical protein ACK40G_13460 [Cytophagaceae bacterium]